MKRRLLASTLLFVAVLFLPHWLYLPLIFLAMLFFPFYWEAVLFGFLIDILYGPSALLAPMSLWASVILLILLPIKERIRG